jgi:hypothetical protein
MVELAVGRDIAVDAPHHVSKGLPDPGNANRARGGSAFKDGGRLVYTLTGMSAEDAKGYDLSADDRRQLVRIDQGKVNLVRASAEPKWLRLVGSELGNTWNPRYPNGDTVQTVEPWYPPGKTHGLDKTVIAEIFENLRRGPGDGEFYSPDPRSTFWLGSIIPLPDPETKALIRDWISNRVLTSGKYHSPKASKWKPRLDLNEAMARDILGSLYRAPP